MRHYAYENLYPHGKSISFPSLNRNKRSIALNSKDPEGIEVAKSIIVKSLRSGWSCFGGNGKG